MTDTTQQTIDVDELRIGMFVRLDLPWMAHPFFSSSFRIRTQHQLDALRTLGLKTVQVDLRRSNVAVSTEPPDDTPPPAAVIDANAASLWEEKNRRIKQLRQRRARLNQCAKNYTTAVGLIRQILARLRAQPLQAATLAGELVSLMLDELKADSQASVQLANLKHLHGNDYHHAINVTSLALILGQRMGFDAAQLRQLGLGALLHDLGHECIPSQVLLKHGPLTPAERQLYETHPQRGAELARAMGSLPVGVIEIIARHHEHLDGSGFPGRLPATEIGLLTRVIAIVNRYDNLCNGQGANHGLSPHQAIAWMYNKERAHFDPGALTAFISGLGVYPPGTAVSLDDGQLGVVISVNSDDLLKPSVLLYSEEIAREEALIVDLAEEELAIRDSLPLQQLSREQIEYLNLSDKLSYYHSSTSGSR